MINILLAEPQKIMREGIKSLLKDQPDIKIIGHAETGKDIIDQLSILPVNVVILDNSQTEMNGIETTKYIKEHYREVKVLATSAFEDQDNMMLMFEAGAEGYILKRSGVEDLIKAIKRISEGNSYLCSDMAFGIIGKLKENRSSISKKEHAKVPELSPREQEVLHLISEGYTNSEIAEKIFSSKRTVETHRKNIITKTETRNTASLIKYAIFNQMILN
jgi:DNA-binding NarL/FixJ family response regulator